MNIFTFRHQLIQDYAAYIKSFMQIRDVRIKERRISMPACSGQSP